MNDEPQLTEHLFRVWLMGYLSVFYPEPHKVENAKNIQRRATDIIDFMKEYKILTTKPE